ncbi:MAG: leucyl-tRNA synthetase [Saprospiraceae bacterium]|jgi:leucyl-tRNA synthetase
MEYNPRAIENKWKAYWKEHKVYKVENPKPGQPEKPKFYVLDMFPYPSGSGLHVGHPLGYIASDIFTRYKKMNGFNVLHPMGYDAFGLPAEQYAIQTGVHPAVSTEENIGRYRKQLDNLGFSFDWDREVKTCDPSYYKWTQWIFIQLFEHYYDVEAQQSLPIADLKNRFSQEGNAGIKATTTQEAIFSGADWNAMTAKEQDEVLMNYRLAYRKTSYVNWCEELGTVLANDEVKDGVSERGGYPVERRAMLQWSLRITAYAERLINDLDQVEWSDALKAMQRNWIGRSEGAQLFFEIKDSPEKIEVFTTRADTIFGATFMVLAPEHPLVNELTTADQKDKVAEYLNYVNSRSERERMSEVKEVTGVFLGAYAVNPFTKTNIPIYIGEYVLMDYGTGAIMAVPSDDERDHSFATKYDIPIIDVIDKSKYPGAGLHDKLGILINSDFLNGMEVPAAIEEMLTRIEQENLGVRKVNYKLRDANYSRQRYWGEPFPIKYDKDGVAHAMSLDELPLNLPDLEDFKPASGGKSPLARREDWVNAEEGFTRETDTMPGFAGSSWYFLRYMDAQNDKAFASPEAINYWREVDLYVGGTEHAVGHLMYSRFWHKFLYDKGLVPTVEPFKKLINQGMIQGVIEFIYLMKDKKEGQAHFMCSKLTKMKGITDYAKIPIYVDFVNEYGSENSYLNIDSIKKFIDWRPEYEDAIFECGKGMYHKGEFTTGNDTDDSHMFTQSETGKMSKRYFNVINPDDVVEKYGSDCFRMYEMFLGPVEQSKPWDTKGISGVSNFIRKFWALYVTDDVLTVSEEEPTNEEMKILHTAIKKVTADIERFSFNTCISAFMVATNDLRKINCNKIKVLRPLAKLIAPFAPHIAEELWFRMGEMETSITIQDSDFPIVNPQYLVEDSFSYPISINGKKRALADFPATASKEELETAALALEEIQKWTDGMTIRKVIVVPKRMINIVVG